MNTAASRRVAAMPGTREPMDCAESPRRRVEVIIQLRRGVDAAQGRALVGSLGGQPGADLLADVECVVEVFEDPDLEGAEGAAALECEQDVDRGIRIS